MDSANGLGNLKTNDIVTVTNAGTASNNKDYTIATVASDGSYVKTHEITTTEGAGANISVTHSGFISNKAKTSIFLQKKIKKIKKFSIIF